MRLVTFSPDKNLKSYQLQHRLRIVKMRRFGGYCDEFTGDLPKLRH